MKVVLDIGVLGMNLLLKKAAGMELEVRDFREVARRMGVLFRTLLLAAMYPRLGLGFALAMPVWALRVLAADPASTNAPAAGLLLTDSLGRQVEASTNEVPRGLHPPGPSGLAGKSPNRKRARSYPSQCWTARMKAKGLKDVHFLPPAPPGLAPYLMGLDELATRRSSPGRSWRPAVWIPGCNGPNTGCRNTA